MASFPNDFPENVDAGGHGEGMVMEGFGGNPDENRAYHRAVIRSSGKAPVVLVHGNTGTAVHPQWGWHKVVHHLKSRYGYTAEHFWALSYLGPGLRELEDPYTRNIEDVRSFTDAVRSYTGVDCVDMVGHSMGCHLILCYLAGLKRQSFPIEWLPDLRRYAHAGTIVLIDGAMRGLKSILPVYDEWLPNHDVYQCLVPDNTPFGRDDDPTPESPHNLRYWCCMVPWGFVDNMDQNQGTTGHLDGADENRNYHTGPGHAGHEKVKDDPTIINDWAPYLNAAPPVDPVVITVDPPSGDYAAGMDIRVSVDPPGTSVEYRAMRITRRIAVGVLLTDVAATLAGTLGHGQTLTLAEAGMWEVALRAPGASDIGRTYGIDVAMPRVEIITDHRVDFENALVVSARTDRGTLFLNVGLSLEDGWEPRASVTLTETTEVKAIAITEEGIASEPVTKVFKRAVPWTDQATGTVAEHYVAGRIDINAFLQYGARYGYVQRFSLYKINGRWTDNAGQVSRDVETPVTDCSHESGTFTSPIAVQLSAVDAADPAPRIYYTADNTSPTTGSDYFVSQGVLRFETSGMKILKYFARDRSGNTSRVEIRQFGMELPAAEPLITAYPAPGEYDRSITAVIKVHDDQDEEVTVHYSRDGSVPGLQSPYFIDSGQFRISGNGQHAISCFARDSTGNERREVFYYTIHDTKPPVTRIFPAGGPFHNRVEVSLSTEEPVDWIKYTTDGSTPDETNGTEYRQAFTISESTAITFRSKDPQGHLEAAKSAAFKRIEAPRQVLFDNLEGVDGYIKSRPDGTSRSVVDDRHLAIGAGWDGRISRSVISFDTSILPQSATITEAFLQVGYHLAIGRPWDRRQLMIDVKTGKFGSSSVCQTGDWDEAPTAAAVAAIPPFGHGRIDSSPFSFQGRSAINRSGRTQMRLYFDPDVEMGAYHYLFLTKGASVKLIVSYMEE